MEMYIPGIFIGIIIVMFFYNLFLFFSTKDKNYVYYVLYILGGGLIFTANDGINYPFGNSAFWQILFFGTFKNAFFFFWIVLFTQSFLNIKKYAPRLNVFINIMNFVSLTSVILGHLGFENIDGKISELVGTLGFITLVIAAIVCLRKGYKPARYFLIAHAFLALGTILFILTHLMGLLPINSFSPYYMKIGMSLEIIFSSFALGDRINILKKEAERSQQKIIIQLRENEKLKEKVNRELEEKVRERTIDLSQKNKEITDSIRYAKRIQTAIITSEWYIEKNIRRLAGTS